MIRAGSSLIYYYLFMASNLRGSSSFEAKDDTHALQKIRRMYYGNEPRSRYLPDNILAIYTEESSEFIRGVRHGKFRTVWKKAGYRPEWEKPMHNIYKHLPSLAKPYTGTYTYPNGGSAEFENSERPTVVRYANGEWIRIMDGEVVEIHTLETIEEYARDYAMRAHGEQMYGDRPYVVHLEAVRKVLEDFGVCGHIAIASWLHDVVEDTLTSKADIEREFGSVVADLVWTVTGCGPNRHARNDNMYDKMHKNASALPLKLADRIANVEQAQKDNYPLLTMYRREYTTFNERLRPLRKDLDPMWDRLQKALWPTRA